ncbi:MAG: hypothetical protein KatS3mg104_0041 [Phycisphaerae bacterium]|jgi:hypothetical protein|nr:MAG: hypothetical protein KatS3mg104_0041 [Phycisphaerae bacterium]
MRTAALLSMLHEPSQINSASRRFRDQPVVTWTVARVRQCSEISQIVLAVWEDQFKDVQSLFLPAKIKNLGPRRSIPTLDAITVAQKWSAGWRGGLMASCCWDRGYLASVVVEVVSEVDAVVLVDPSSGLVDPQILHRLVRAAESGTRDYYFSQAPPGLGGVLLKRTMVQKLADGNAHPGRIVHYLPEAPVLDPVTSDACIELPLSVSRSTERLTLDSERQIRRISQATEPLNGTLLVADSDRILQRLGSIDPTGEFPREITVELTTRRNSRPVFLPVVNRDDLSAAQFSSIVDEIQRYDDARLVLGGLGDPLLHPCFEDLLDRCQQIHTVGLETDLIDVSEQTLRAIVEGSIDVVSVHLPAMTRSTYESIMGIDSIVQVIENIKKLILIRQSRGKGTPIIVPTFTKLSSNLAEMEQWYDTWLGAVGSAVIVGPSDYAGKMPDLSVAQMAPPLRKPCRRIESRLTVWSDGSISMCEQDAFSQFSIGKIGETSLESVWKTRLKGIRDSHRCGSGLPVLCQSCQEWHRP